MTHRRKESDVTECNPPSRLKVFVTSVQLHLRLTHVKFQQFWYFADRPAKMSVAKRFLRTKQILILITSLLFIVGTIWFGSHPDVTPVTLRQRKMIFVLPTVPTKPFADRSSLIARLGLNEDFSVVNRTLQEDSIQTKDVAWELDLPWYADTDAPAIATALFKREDYETSIKQIWSVQQYANKSHLAIFDLVPAAERKDKSHRLDNLYTNDTVELFCNMTKVCSIYNAPLLEDSLVPKYIHHKEYGAYKAIFVQKMLKHFPMVLWLDTGGLVPVAGLEGIWNRTDKDSITTWELSSHCTVSAFTFPKMMPYFGFSANDLNFVTMIESGSYAFKKTPRVLQLVSMWLNCSLTENCIKPIGVDSPDCPGVTCIHSHPKTAYLRCHKYETSALSSCITKLNFPHAGAPYIDYPLDASVQEESDAGYNTSLIKSNILFEKSRLRRLSKHRAVHWLSDFEQ
ncbi:uncharacterized protein [Watersipora subatra]|uniref:uncharacterized protein n=1 Tax=Watersipora subatra TaxID=2589382 RepID=UPI00355C83E5